MNWVEFIGPSGVGKSYYLTKIRKELQKAKMSERSIISKTGARPKSRPFGRLLSMLIHQPPTRNLKRELLDCRPSELFCGFEVDGIRNNLDLFRRGLSIFNHDPIRYISRCDWYYNKRLLPFLEISEYAGEDEFIMHDDGILHNNDGFTMDNIRKLPTNHLMLPHSAIYLDAQLDYIIRNRYNRMDSHDQSEYLADECRTAMKIAEMKAEALSSLGVPVHRIDVEAGELIVMRAIRDLIVLRING